MPRATRSHKPSSTSAGEPGGQGGEFGPEAGAPGPQGGEDIGCLHPPRVRRGGAAPHGPEHPWEVLPHDEGQRGGRRRRPGPTVRRPGVSRPQTTSPERQSSSSQRASYPSTRAGRMWASHSAAGASIPCSCSSTASRPARPSARVVGVACCHPREKAHEVTMGTGSTRPRRRWRLAPCRRTRRSRAHQRPSGRLQGRPRVLRARASAVQPGRRHRRAHRRPAGSGVVGAGASATVIRPASWRWPLTQAAAASSSGEGGRRVGLPCRSAPSTRRGHGPATRALPPLEPVLPLRHRATAPRATATDRGARPAARGRGWICSSTMATASGSMRPTRRRRRAARWAEGSPGPGEATGRASRRSSAAHRRGT